MQHLFFYASKILEFLLSPLSWIVILLLLAVFIKNKRKSQRCFKWSVALLLLFSNPFIINLVMHQWEVPATKIDSLSQTYDAAIMMGGAIRYVNSQMERPVFGSGADRYMQALELYYQGKVKNIIITSGSGSLVYDKIKEADLLKDQMVRTGIDPKHIIAENESRNTYENAKFTSDIIRKTHLKGPFVLVTSAFHMRRSVLCFRKQGVEVIPFSVDQHSGSIMVTPDKLLIPSIEALLDWDLLLHEWFGILIYKVMGYL